MRSSFININVNITHFFLYFIEITATTYSLTLSFYYIPYKLIYSLVYFLYRSVRLSTGHRIVYSK